METGVREILVKALNRSAIKLHLIAHWRDRFPNLPDNLMIYSPVVQGCVSPDFIEAIMECYTPAGILSILAVARFEGIWSPE